MTPEEEKAKLLLELADAAIQPAAPGLTTSGSNAFGLGVVGSQTMGTLPKLVGTFVSRNIEGEELEKYGAPPDVDYPLPGPAPLYSQEQKTRDDWAAAVARAKGLESGEQARKDMLEIMGQASAEHPVASFAGGMVPLVSASSGPMTLGKTMATGAQYGAGSAAGSRMSEMPLDTDATEQLKQMLPASAIGGATGMLAGGAAYGAGKVLSKAPDKLKELGEWLQKKSDYFRARGAGLKMPEVKNIVDQMGSSSPTESFSDLGATMRKYGIGGGLSSSENIATVSSEKLADAGKLIGDALSEFEQLKPDSIVPVSKVVEKAKSLAKSMYNTEPEIAAKLDEDAALFAALVESGKMSTDLTAREAHQLVSSMSKSAFSRGGRKEDAGKAAMKEFASQLRDTKNKSIESVSPDIYKKYEEAMKMYEELAPITKNAQNVMKRVEAANFLSPTNKANFMLSEAAEKLSGSGDMEAAITAAAKTAAVNQALERGASGTSSILGGGADFYNWLGKQTSSRPWSHLPLSPNMAMSREAGRQTPSVEQSINNYLYKNSVKPEDDDTQR